MKFANATKLDRKFGVPRLSYIAVPAHATYAAFRKERRMKFANATKLDRKFGVPRLSYIAVPAHATYAAFRKERRMKFANANQARQEIQGRIFAL